MSLLRIGVLASGRGSNLQAIIDAIQAQTLKASISVVVSNNQHSAALDRARHHGLNGVWLDSKPYAHESDPHQAYDRKILQVLKEFDVQLVVLAGYMKIITPTLIHAYLWRVMNIHPSLLPAFPRLNAQKQAFEWGAKITGCTVHFVTEGVDEGPIIMQASAPIEEEDTIETLSARVLELEHQIYPQAIQLFAEGKLCVEGRRVRIVDSGSQRVVGC